MQKINSAQATAIFAAHGGGVTGDMDNALHWIQDPLANTDEGFMEELYEMLAESESISPEMIDQMRAATAHHQPEEPEIFLHEGDYVTETLEPTSDMLIITGNVQLSKYLKSAHFHDNGTIIILGSLVSEVAIITGSLIVGGGMNVRHIYASSGNDCGLVVGGNLLALSILETGQYIKAYGAIFADTIISTHNSVEADGGVNAKQIFLHETPNISKPSTVLEPVLIDAAGYIDDDAYITWLIAGNNPLKK